MYKVGLTGGIGSGKTLVCSVLEKLGVPVYYADTEARSLMNSDPELQAGIVELFGGRSYGQNGIDRDYIAAVVFGDDEKLSQLNSLVHPAVRSSFHSWAASQENVPYVVEEAAILFESGASREMDLTVQVYAGLETRINRVMSRDGVGRDDVLRRMRHQMDEEEKAKLADYVISNDDTMLLPQVIELHTRILNSIE